MKTKFTPKQIATFQSMVNNGVLEYICANHEERETILTDIGEKFAELEEGKFIREQTTDSQAIVAAEERGELSFLAQSAVYRCCKDGNVGKNFANSVLNSLNAGTGNRYVCFNGVDYKRSFIKALGLRDWATKADVMKEIEGLIG